MRKTKTVATAAASISLFAAAVSQAQIAPQTLLSLTPTSVADVDYGGEVVSIGVSQAIVTGCPQATAYVIRDANIIKGGLAVAMAALVGGRQIDLYLTGSCDTGGNPLVGSINMH